MKTSTKVFRGDHAVNGGQSLVTGLHPALMFWVTSHEVESLRVALTRGLLPPDFIAKLQRLSAGDLSQQFIAQNCRLFAMLLQASEKGLFRQCNHAQREWLMRVMTYVRKEDDAIPDYRADGFVDDQKEVRAAVVELGELIGSFKAWRLQHQVPAMWHGQTGCVARRA